MLQSNITILRIACALLFLTTALSAQRYTGHDHAVFHRPPQASPAKHQPAPPANGVTSHQKAPAASPQQASRAANGSGNVDVDSNRTSPPAKIDPPLDNSPRL